MSAPIQLNLIYLPLELTYDAVCLDSLTLGGMWTEDSYRTEIQREHSICLGVTTLPFLSNQKSVQDDRACKFKGSRLLAMGCSWIVLDEAHLTMIAVHPDFQRRGLARLILNRLLLLSALRDCRRATLEVEVSNNAAINLYQSLLFKPLGKRPDYYGIGKDAYIFWLNQLQDSVYQKFLQDSWIESCKRLQSHNLEIITDLIF